VDTTRLGAPDNTETIRLLQSLIRNRCVNDGTAASGQEIRNADLLAAYLGDTGLDLQRFEPTPGRASLVARIEGSDPTAPSLCLMGHTDVVPVNESGWTHDPFAGEVIDGEVWGRGAVDMLNLTSSMAVTFRHLAANNFRPRGDLIFFAVADEESGSAHGMRWMADNAYDAIKADYVLTENGGLHDHGGGQHRIGVTVGEKGVAWRRLRVTGTPGHGSAPYKTNNALMTAAKVMQRIGEYQPPPRFHELWRQQVDALDLDDDGKAALLDERTIDAYLDTMPLQSGARNLHACSHTTFSVNVAQTQTKTNVIPDTVDIDVDIRTMPGDDKPEVLAHLRAALGDLADRVEVSEILSNPASISQTTNPLWDSIGKAIAHSFPGATPNGRMLAGFTDARIYREKGAVAYGAGLMSPNLAPHQFASRFHGNDERIDTESLALTTEFYLNVVTDLLG
jgi:acetylornithine deacetylase/succinyl-diaminopimelate desuccinylase-like protein